MEFINPRGTEDMHLLRNAGEHPYGTLMLGYSTMETCEPGSWGAFATRALEGPEKRNGNLGDLVINMRGSWHATARQAEEVAQGYTLEIPEELAQKFGITLRFLAMAEENSGRFVNDALCERENNSKFFFNLGQPDPQKYVQLRAVVSVKPRYEIFADYGRNHWKGSRLARAGPELRSRILTHYPELEDELKNGELVREHSPLPSLEVRFIKEVLKGGAIPLPVGRPHALATSGECWNSPEGSAGVVGGGGPPSLVGPFEAYSSVRESVTSSWSRSRQPVATESNLRRPSPPATLGQVFEPGDAKLDAAETWGIFAERVDGVVREAVASHVSEGRVMEYSKCEARFGMFLREHGLEDECMVKSGDMPSEVNYFALSQLEERLQLMVFIAFGAWSRQNNRSAEVEMSMLRSCFALAMCDTSAFDSEVMRRARSGLRPSVEASLKKTGGPFGFGYLFDWAGCPDPVRSWKEDRDASPHQDEEGEEAEEWGWVKFGKT